MPLLLGRWGRFVTVVEVLKRVHDRVLTGLQASHARLQMAHLPDDESQYRQHCYDNDGAQHP
jgi:hypothetical protein